MWVSSGEAAVSEKIHVLSQQQFQSPTAPQIGCDLMADFPSYAGVWSDCSLHGSYGYYCNHLWVLCAIALLCPGNTIFMWSPNSSGSSFFPLLFCKREWTVGVTVGRRMLWYLIFCTLTGFGSLCLSPSKLNRRFSVEVERRINLWT